ncbi:MAG TPA: diguanylate cyclase [Mycobacteriales bacterium]|jgi:diguanylate cyclase (GGDEF) domain
MRLRFPTPSGDAVIPLGKFAPPDARCPAGGRSRPCCGRGLLEEQLRRIRDDEHLLCMLLELTFHHQASGAGDRAVLAAEHAMLVAKRMGDQVWGGRALCARSMARRAQRDYEGALDDGVRAMRVLEKSGANGDRAWSQVSLGVLHHELGEDVGAHSYLHEGLGIGQADGNPRLEAAAMHTLGRLAVRGGDYGRAYEYGARALSLRRSHGGTTEIVESLALLAETSLSQWRDNEDVDEDVVDALPLLHRARGHLDEALALVWRYGNRNLEAVLLSDLGEVLVGAGQPESVVALLEAVLPELSHIDNRAGLCRLLATLGTAYTVIGEDDRALTTLDRALTVADESEVPALAQPLHRDLARVHERLGDLAQALAHHKAYHQALRRSAIARTVEQSRLHAVRLEIEESRREAARLREEAASLRTKIQGLQLRSRQLDALAREDWLTGVANRRTLDQWLAEALALARTHLRPLAVALADIDHFKLINDRHSHQVGDVVLRETARILCRHVRRSDLVARYGGEEFVLAFPDATVVQAVMVCERIRVDVAQHEWSRIAPDLHVTISIGVADGMHAASAEDALAGADARMYRAKRDGRNAVHPTPYSQDT